MLKNKKITVVIPTLNEAKGIRATIEVIPKFVDEIIVVDGGSKDETQKIARECGAKVVEELRPGYGRAFKTGFEHATGDIIGTTDGDGTYPIELLESVVNQLLEKQLEFISCSRLPLEDASSMRKRNLIGNFLMTQAASVMWVHHFSDILSGMWVFRRPCLKKLTLLSDSWNFSEEIKLQAYMHLGDKFAEYKIPYRERLGETKLVPWKVGLQNIGYMIAMRTKAVGPLKQILKRPF
jgi:glycosyltransferase involved in cell wall biosynthesis